MVSCCVPSHHDTTRVLSLTAAIDLHCLLFGEIVMPWAGLGEGDEELLGRWQHEHVTGHDWCLQVPPFGGHGGRLGGHGLWLRCCLEGFLKMVVANLGSLLLLLVLRLME